MTDMIEKVAKAIAVADLNASAKSLPDVPMETMAEYVRLAVEDGHYQAMARAAIEAMREPTDAMLDDGRDRANDYLDCGCYSSQETVGECWKAMIDAALNGKEG